MTRSEFMAYLDAFERRVIIKGFEAGRWNKTAMVSIRGGRLARSPLAKLVGTRFVYDKPLAIEYYGLVKKSHAFMAKVADVYEHYQIKAMHAPIVNVLGVRVEDVAELAPDLQARFGEFRIALRRAALGEDGADRLLITSTSTVTVG